MEARGFNNIITLKLTTLEARQLAALIEDNWPLGDGVLNSIDMAIEEAVVTVDHQYAEPAGD